MIEKNKNVLVKTVTLYYLGKVENVDDKFLLLSNASWVQDTGKRLTDFLADGFDNTSEIEIIGDCLIGLNQVVEVCEWKHELPNQQI
jgi:hypothetical protein